MKIQKRGAIVTGASQGLGKEIAVKLIADGYDLLICARDKNQLEQTQKILTDYCSKDQQVLAMQCDVSQCNQVDLFFKKAQEKLSHYNVLINNAGVYGPMGSIDDVNWNEWVSALEINILGTVYPCKLAVKHFKNIGGGRIVNISGGGATNPLPRISSYATSKAAVVRFTETLAQEVIKDNIVVNAIAPGALNTRMMDQLLAAGPEKVGSEMFERMMKLREDGCTPLEIGASLCAFLASTDISPITGRLISAVWDPWQDFAKYSTEIAESDIYTLRRILPSERGKKWGEK